MRFAPCFAALFLSTPAWSSTLTLDQALSLAHKDSPQIQKSHSVREEAEWKRVEGFATFLPTVTGTATYLTNKNYLLTDVQLGGSPTPVSIPQIIPTTQYQLSAQYTLFEGFAGWNRFDAAKAQERAAVLDDDWAQFQTDRQVTLQFYRAVAALQLREVAQANLKTLQDHQRDVGLFRRAGISTNFDVLRVDVQVSEAQSEILNSEDNVEVARGRLAELTGQNESAEVMGQLPVPAPDKIQGLQTEILRERNDLRSLHERVLAATDLEQAAAWHWSPKINAFGTYQYYNNRDDSATNWDKFRDAYQVGLTLTWTFFDGLVSTARAHQAIEQRFQAERGERQMLLKAQQDLNFWKRKFLYFCTVYRSRLSDIEKSKESVRLAKEGRRVGARTNTDLLDAEAELFRAQAGAVNAQMGSIEALINLELVTGRKLL